MTRSPAAGAQAIIWTCHGGANQRWTLTGTGELRVYGDRCLDVNGGATTAGAKIQIWTCNGTAAGTLMRRWDCNGTAAQRWARS